MANDSSDRTSAYGVPPGFEADPLVADALGAEFKEKFLDQKMAEWDKAFFQVSQEQREAMLTYI
jgi:glutamine synthetase